MNICKRLFSPSPGQGMAHRILLLTFLVVVQSGCSDSEEGPGLREPEPVGGPALMRSLTESQYRATVEDIFGPETPVVARFERALRGEGLIAVGTSEAGLSSFSVEQYDAAARGVADFVFSEEQRGDYLRCAPDAAAGFDADCAREFITEYGPQLFRRPLEDAHVARYMATAEMGTQALGDFYAGLKYALVGMMTAPQFLLRIEYAEPDPQSPGLQRLDSYSSATRLSYFLTDSTPDRELLRAARNGELFTEAGLARQVDRLIDSPRFETAVRAFFSDMLEFDMFDDIAKDAAIYPAYNSAVALDAQEQTLRDITYHLLSQRGDYRDLFTLDKTFMTRELGVIYRQPVTSRDGWERTSLSNAQDRLGIQSHISFLALHSHPGRSSPTLRGESVRNVFLCQEVPEAPADIDFSIIQDPSPDFMPTARDRLTAHNTEPACSGCHKVMDPVGFALENYDGVGTYRTHEHEALIDASGFLDGTAYSDSAGLARALRNHPETPRCLVEKMYRFAVGRDTEWHERAYMDYLIAKFAEQGYQVPELMRAIALSENFFTIAPSKPEYQMAYSEKTLRNES